MLSLKNSIKLYKTVGHRNPYLFEWLYKIYKKTALSSIDSRYAKNLMVTKAKLTIFDVLIDDIADNGSLRNKALLSRLVHIPWESKKDNANGEYYEACKKIWNDCMNSIKEYPRFGEFEEIFYYDLKQVMNSMEFSNLINTYVYLDNIIENETYGHHGLMVMLHGMLDIMCSPKINRKELGRIRELLYLAQKNARIGNMLNTYPREILEKDVSSEIITYAIENNYITSIDENPEKILPILKRLEDRFKNEAEKNFNEMAIIGNSIKSLNVKKFIADRKYIHKEFIRRIKYWEK